MGSLVYILRMSDGRLYVGMTDNLERRLAEHGVKSSTRTTEIFGVKEIIHVEEFPDRASARKRERQLKGWSRAKKLALARGDVQGLKRLSKCRVGRAPKLT